MKKIIIVLFALVLSAVSCDFDYDLKVIATGTFFYGLDSEIAQETFDRGFHSRYLSEYQIENIYHSLSTKVSPDFTMAQLHLDIYNQIGNRFMGTSDYSVTPNSAGGLDIMELTAEY